MIEERKCNQLHVQITVATHGGRVAAHLALYRTAPHVLQYTSPRGVQKAARGSDSRGGEDSVRFMPLAKNNVTFVRSKLTSMSIRVVICGQSEARSWWVR